MSWGLSEGGKTGTDGPGEEPGDGVEPSLSRDDLFDVLGNDRRRYVLEVVLDHEGAVGLEELVEEVATRDFEKPVAELSDAEWKAVNTALKQRQIPKLEEKGLIAVDHETGEVTPSESFGDLDVYLEIVSGTGVPASLTYLLMSTLGGLLLAAATLDLYPATVLTDVQIATALVALFGVASLSYLGTVRRRKADARRPDLAVESDQGEAVTTASRTRPGVVLGAAVLGGVGGGLVMWLIFHYVMFLTPALAAVYGLDRFLLTLGTHLGHSVLLAIPFGVAVARTRLRTVAATAGETAALGALYGVVLWAGIGGIVFPNVTPVAVETLVTWRGYDLLYLPLDGLAAHVIYGSLLGGIYGFVRNALSGSR